MDAGWFVGGDCPGDGLGCFSPRNGKDPSTGKIIKAPQYGGQIVIASALEPPHVDSVLGGQGWRIIDLVVEMLSIVDWSIPRDKWGFYESFDPPIEHYIPHLAESVEMPDPLTLIFHIRRGVPWQNKPPMNGRELTADDIVYNFHRVTGLGSGFTEKSVTGDRISGCARHNDYASEC